MLLQPADQAVGAVLGIEPDVESGLGARRDHVGRRVADIDRRHVGRRRAEMRRSGVEFAPVDRRQHRQQAGDRIVGKVRVGDVALLPLDDKPSRQAAAAAVLDYIAKRLRARRFADNAHVRAMAVRGRPFDHLHGPVDGIALFVAGNHEADRPVDILGRHAGDGGYEGGNAAFHVGGATAIKPPVTDFGGKGIMRPGSHVTDRHHVGMAGETQMRACPAAPREQIVDSGITFAKGKPLTGETKARQFGFQTVQRAAFLRRHRRAADQSLRQFNSMRRRPHQSRNSSLTEVLDRVFSSTFLMITAQESDGPGVPSASGLPGSDPGTTTE